VPRDPTRKSQIKIGTEPNPNRTDPMRRRAHELYEPAIGKKAANSKTGFAPKPKSPRGDAAHSGRHYPGSSPEGCRQLRPWQP
jgi:hypothetical protein